MHTYHHYNFICMYPICQMPIDHAFTWDIEIGNTYNSTMGKCWCTKFTTQKPCSSYHIVSLPHVFKGINKHWNNTSWMEYYVTTHVLKIHTNKVLISCWTSIHLPNYANNTKVIFQMWYGPHFTWPHYHSNHYTKWVRFFLI